MLRNSRYGFDILRYSNSRISAVDRIAFSFLMNFRRVQLTKSSVIKLISRIRLMQLRKKYGLEIPNMAKIGKGLCLAHPFNITVSPNAVIGENCNLHKGVTIGQENRGVRKGAPTIGSYVWLGVNATVVGNVHIGNDVLIAPNAFVNCDIPDHSIVIGNPCTIKHRENATEGYINNCL